MSSSYHTQQEWESIVFRRCLLMLEIDILFNVFIKYCMFITSTTRNSKDWSIAKFESNWAYSWARGSIIIGVGWSSTSIPSVDSLFKSTHRWTSLSPCQIHQLSRVVLCINNFLPCQPQIFFSRHFLTSNIQRWNETWLLLLFYYLLFIILKKISNFHVH